MVGWLEIYTGNETRGFHEGTDCSFYKEIFGGTMKFGFETLAILRLNNYIKKMEK